MTKRGAPDEVSNADLAAMITTLSNKVDNSLKLQQYDRSTSKINKVECRLNAVESTTTSKVVIVTGEPAVDGQDFTGLNQKIIKIAKVLDVTITEQEIDDIWRFGKNKENIKVIFLRSVVKREIIKRVRKKKSLTL